MPMVHVCPMCEGWGWSRVEGEGGGAAAWGYSAVEAAGQEGVCSVCGSLSNVLLRDEGGGFRYCVRCRQAPEVTNGEIAMAFVVGALVDAAILGIAWAAGAFVVAAVVVGAHIVCSAGLVLFASGTCRRAKRPSYGSACLRLRIVCWEGGILTMEDERVTEKGGGDRYM
jgi:hypothetical protein